MCHYDTVRAFDSDAPRVKGEPLKFKDAELRAFKREMEDELRRQIQDPAANVSVTVGLGISPPPGLQEAVENAFEMKAIQTDGTMSCEVPQGPRQRQTQYGTFSLGPVEPQEGVGAKRETVGQQRAREKEELLQKEQKRQAAGFSAKPSEPKQGTGCSIM